MQRLALDPAIYSELISPKAFQLAAGKIDKVSGDIRVCFEIMRGAIQSKIEKIKSMSRNSPSNQLKLGYEEVHEVVLEMYESKVVKLVRKLPRSHLVLLSEMCDYMHEKSGFAMADLWLTETELLNMFNRKATQLMIDKIAPGELSDIVHTLANSDIILMQDGKMQKSRTKNLKAFKVSFKCELAEVEGALA